MNKNIKRLFLLTTVLMILLTISAIDATEVSNDTVIDDSSVSSQNIISDSIKDTVSDTSDNKEITKKDIKNDVVTKGAATHIVNNDNVDEIFSGSGYNLSDTINEGDTLDFQGTIDKEHAIKISKPVNIISSTQDAVISLHSEPAGFDPGDPGKAFVVNTGASGSNITGLYLNNTQFWVYSAQNVYFKNMSMIVKDAKVGTGTGQSAIRWSNNITLDECHIYTENNGGSTSVALTMCTNCSIINSKIEGFGNVGNILYLANPYGVADGPEEYKDMFLPQLMQLNITKNISVINCTINTPNGGGICEPLYGVPYGCTIENCLINATGGLAQTGVGGTFVNNTLINGAGLTVGQGAEVSGNTVDGGESRITGKEAQVHDNTFGKVTISGASVNFTDNTVNDVISVTGKNAIIDGNHIETSTAPAIQVNSAATGATITDNYIVAGDVIGDEAISVNSAVADSVTLSGNGPESIIEIILTDETWDQFFNEDGTLKEGVVEEGDELQFHGTFTNRQMNITTPITITTGETQAVFDGCTFTISSPTTIKNVQFTGTTPSHSITANANLTFENVTFDGVKSTEAYMINPGVRANITFNNCTVSNFEGNAVVRSSAKRTGISVTVIDSVFKDNNAAFSVFCEFGNGWTINLTNSNFTNNNGQNGAVVQGMSTGTTLKLYVDNCNFDSNTATGKAGVIYSASNNAIISLTNSNFTDNKVTSSSSGSSTTNLAHVITLGTGNTNLTLQNNIMTGSTAENATDIYFELSSAGTGKIFTNAKLTAENATTDKDQYVDLKFKLTDDMGNLIGFKAGNIFNYSVTLNDEVISYVDGGPYYGNLYGFYGSQNKTINATYPGGLYPITIDVTAGTDKFDSLEIINGQLEVIAPKPTPTISYEVINDVEGKVAVEFTLVDEEGSEISPAALILTGDITATANTNKVYKNSELTEGEYAVTVKFEETEDYQEATLDFTLTVQKDPQEIIDELNESLINNQTALEGKITALEQLQAENEALQEQIENLTEALEANQTALAGNITALEEATEQIAQLEENITALTEALEANQTALAGNITALEEANEQIAQLEENITALTEALEANQTALAQAEETITQLNNNITALEEELNETQSALTEAEETITELENNITALEEELADTQSDLAESEEENANLTANVAELEAALAANQTALAEAQETIEGLNNNITALESELNETNAALSEAQETIEDLNNVIDALEDELEQTQTELNETQEALDEANETIEDLNNVIDALEDELEETQAELNETQEALDDANEAIEELEYKVSELELGLDIANKALDKAIEAITQLNQPKATSISIDAIEGVKYGDEINITGLLVNEDAIGLANQPVTITLNGEEIEVTTRNGEFTYTTTADIIGENTITVTYAGSDKYTASEATATFNVAKANTTIELTELEAVKKGDVVSISGILYDHNNNALANKVVRLLVNTGRKTVKTDKMGAFSFDYTTTRVGINTLTATFEGNDYYEAVTAESTFTVEALSTVITFDDMGSFIKGNEATISGTLTDEKGNAIANAQVKLSINGSPKTLKTDSEGRFTHTYTFGKVGENTITAAYAGSNNYEAANVETTVNVTKTEATITLEPIEEVSVGSSVTISGTLTYADGNPIANAQVKVLINGSPKTLKTDEFGAFTHTFKMTKEGTNNITAIFNGNNDYSEAETNSTVMVIKAE